MKKIYLVLFVILSIFVFSCKDNLISDDLSSSQNSGAGQVKVFVKQSRLIGPDVSEVTWNVKLQKSGENNTISGKNENGYYLFSGLSDGTYNITVSGKIDDVEKFTGSAVTTITNGNSVSVNVPIVAKKTDKDAYDDEKTGYATITMDMSDKLLSLLNSMVERPNFNANLSTDSYGTDANITASLVKISTDEQAENVSIEFFDNQEVKFENYTSYTDLYKIPTGYYYLTFSGLEDFSFTIKLKDNLVEIGDGLTTNIVLTQNDYELVQGNSYYQYTPTVFYVDNSNNQGDDSSIVGTSLSKPLGFTNINDNISGTFYLISDVEAYKEDEENGSKSFPGIEGEENTITSFGSNIFSITNNIHGRFVSLYSTTLKNIKLTNTTGTGFILSDSTIDGTVILDTPIVQDSDSVQGSNTDSTVIISKSSNLVIGQKFSGELGIRLFPENWQLGDTVITFENGVKPSNSNFYISEDNDMPTGFASMFYIDDKGKLAQYDATSQWVNFAWNEVAWNEVEPYLITQTQAKNKTYTSIYDSNDGYLYGFNGISTYDEENQTWYFIANGTDENGDTVPSLYKVSAPTEYTDIVSPEKIEVDGIFFDSVQAMAYDNGKLYFGSKEDDFNLHFMEDEQLKSCSIQITSQDYYIGDLTSLLVKGNEVYFATTVTSTNGQNNNPTTHSAIWKCLLTKDSSSGRYSLSHSQTYQGDDYPVPYYLTHSDIELTVNGSLPEGSTFRITDLYSDGNSVYGLLANYIEKEGAESVGSNDKNKSFMRGSVFKLTTNSSRQENSEPIMNANHFGLRKSFPLTLENLATAKKYFILPRKIVGILNKKLVIVDDGMVPDLNDCNVDRFVLFDLFDLADEISETIDVAVPFSTNGVANTSESRFYTSNSLFN